MGYESERKAPTVGYCRPASKDISLSFNGHFLKILVSDGKKMVNKGVYAAVSGTKLNGKFDYSVARQKVKNKGPIPVGTYWINPDELWERSRLKFWMKDGWGNYRLSLHPYSTTTHHDRGGFFIHGGASPGSAGCIDLTDRMDRFIGDVKKLLGSEKTCRIDVVVKY